MPNSASASTIAFATAASPGVIPPERHRTVEGIQRRFFEAAPYAYAGQSFLPVAYRKDRLRGVIGLAAPVYWNMGKLAG